MSNVILVVTTQETPLPTGVSASGQLRYQLLDASGNVIQTQDSQELTVTFSDVAEGTYTAAAVALDSTGAVLGLAQTAQVVVPAATPVVATYAAPSSIVVALS